MPEGDICAHCGQRPARYWSYTILQPVVLRITPMCGPCSDAEKATATADSEPSEVAEPTPSDAEAHMLALGPIDWRVLGPQLAELDDAGDTHASDRAFVADAVRRVAAHHGQALPVDVATFIARYAPREPIKWGAVE